MHKIGLKLWSTNENYIEEAVKLYNKGLYDYIELYAVPGSFQSCINFWKDLNIPFIVHAPHYYGGINLACKEQLEINLSLTTEVIYYAEELNAKHIIYHPGVNGSLDETILQLQKINDSRIVIENKPYYGIDNSLICNGYSPEQIKQILEKANMGFCLDIGHAIFAANAINIDPMKQLKDFINLNPSIIHLSDGSYNGIIDEHLNYGSGSFPLSDIIDLLNSDKLLTIETTKNYKDSLSDFVEDVRVLNRIINKYTLREADKTDLMDVFQLANDSFVRQYAFNTEEISIEDHILWFTNKINSPDCIFYIARDNENKLIGYVRFDKNHKKENSYITSIALTADFRGKGFGTKLLKDSTESFYNKYKDQNLYAYIKKVNNASLKIFSKVNYVVIEDEFINGEECHLLLYMQNH